MIVTGDGSDKVRFAFAGVDVVTDFDFGNGDEPGDRLVVSSLTNFDDATSDGPFTFSSPEDFFSFAAEVFIRGGSARAEGDDLVLVEGDAFNENSVTFEGVVPDLAAALETFLT